MLRGGYRTARRLEKTRLIQLTTQQRWSHSDDTKKQTSQLRNLVDRLYDNKRDAETHERFLKEGPCLSGVDFKDFLLADTNGDGRVNSVEWENFLRRRQQQDSGKSYDEPLALNIEIPLSPSQAHTILNEGDGLHVHINGMRYAVSLTPEGDTQELIKSKGDLLLETIQRIAALNVDKRPLDARAARHTKRVLTMGLVYLLGQASVIAKLTFFSRFGWDVMEPITYFITFGTAILSFVFFQYHKIEYSYPAVAALLTQRKALRLYTKYGFDIRNFNELQALAVKYEKQLAVLEPPKSMIATKKTPVK